MHASQSQQGRRAPLHVVVCTHTSDRLARTLTALAHQTRPPTGVVLSCDSDAQDIADVARAVHADTGLPILLVQRPKATPDRLSQVRNNAVNALLACDPTLWDDRDHGLVFLDGDCVPMPDFVEQHAAALTRGDLVLAFRHDLTPEQTEAFDDDAVRAKRWPTEPTPEQVRKLTARQSRYKRQLLMKTLGIGKPHKPKILGGNFGTRLSRYLEVNGMDEQFHGWGGEDDDYARRVYQAGGKPIIAIEHVVALHQYHPTRAPGNWHDHPNAALSARKSVPTRCERGLDNQWLQGPVRLEPLGMPHAAGFEASAG